jgi:eukaryotic-like serine/threonine-protein kinase
MADTPDRTIPTNTTAKAEPPTLPDDYSGRVLGDFELVRRIGVGGMGQVYLARQRSLKRQVAIKILRGELAANVTALKRFQAEAEAVASLTHAHIVQVYAIDEDQGLHYMALEYVDGRNLRDYLERKGIPDLPLALEIMRQVASALERAGELGFVHRDIKPENILLSKRGEVKITDFGLSRAFATDAPIHLTQSGVTMGTPLYMSPEQVRGQPVDPRSDIYSFGVTCYHMLAGEPPFRGAGAFDVAVQHVQGDARPLSALRPDLPPELCAVVHKMMARRPDDRYQSAREILNDLARFKDGVGLTTGAVPMGSGMFNLGVGGSSTSVPAVAATQMPTQHLPMRSGSWRYALVAGVALVAAGGGAALHWAQTSTPTVKPEDALADVDPSPAAMREKELKRQIHDKATKVEVAANDLLELAELYIDERRFEDALKLFDRESVARLGAFEMLGKEPARDREQLNILSGLGKAIVLAYWDRAGDSNAEFVRVAKAYPPLLKKDDAVTPKVRPDPKGVRGQLEQFFNKNISGPNWKRAVGDAIERNAKNFGDKPMPDELRRMRLLPSKGRPMGE